MSKAETLRRFIADRLAALTQEVLAAFDGVVAAYEEASPGCGLEEPPHDVKSKRLLDEEEEEEEEGGSPERSGPQTQSRPPGGHGRNRTPRTRRGARILRDPDADPPSGSAPRTCPAAAPKRPPSLSAGGNHGNRLGAAEDAGRHQEEGRGGASSASTTPSQPRGDGPAERHRLPGQQDVNPDQRGPAHQARGPAERSAGAPRGGATGVGGQCRVCGRSSAGGPGPEEGPRGCGRCEELEVVEGQSAPSRKRFLCGECGKWLCDSRSLSRHKMTHSEERPHGCRVCGRSFKLAWTLRQHEKIHTDRERLFLCEVCCKMFLTSKQLQIHLRGHSGLKPFSCSHCGKSFSTRGQLGVHTRVHTGETPYRCPDCGWSFKCKVHLDNHMRVHSGHKPFVCGTCGKACARKTYLTVHMRTHNGERPYRCSLCPQAFTQSHCLKSHMKRHQGPGPAGPGPAGPAGSGPAGSGPAGPGPAGPAGPAGPGPA